MFKKTQKKLSVIVVLAMVFTMLLGFGAPAAASTVIDGVVVGTVPTIVTIGDVNLGSIRYAETTPGNLTDGDTIKVKLPSGVKFQTGLNVANYVEHAGLGHLGGVTPVVNAVYDEITYTIHRTSLLSNAQVVLKLPATVSTVPTSGTITATVTPSGTGINGGSFVVGQFGQLSAAVRVVGTTKPNLSKYTTTAQNLTGMEIRIKENGVGAVAVGTSTTNRIVLTLPEGITWNGFTAPGFSSSVVGRKLYLYRTGTPSGVNDFAITNMSVLVSRLAAGGDLVVDVAGEGLNGDIAGTVTVATVGDFAITVARQNASTTNPAALVAGFENSLSVLEIKENAAAALAAGGTVTVTLPEGVKFQTAAISGLTFDKFSTDKRTATFNVNSYTGSATTFTMTSTVNVSPAFSGDLDVTVAGSAGATGTATLAKVKSVATVASSSVSVVKAGLNDQAVGDIVITEAAAKALNGTLTLTLPAGVKFNGTPTVTRTSGNVTLGTASVSVVSGLDQLSFTVSPGTTAAVITISDISYDVDRTVMDGNINVTLGGSAFVDTNTAAAFSAAVKVFNARIGAAGSTVFTIGQTAYTVDGRAYTMDVAPVIKEGRTLLPLRFAADAAGTQEIIWDPVRKTVTLIRGDRVVQVTIGSTTMLINGAAITMDVAPEIVDGRTMLPIRWIGMALRANVEWNATARTVTVAPY